MKNDEIKKILISRTDNIGDVVLTIPMAFVLKKSFPNAKIAFLGKHYTKDIIGCSEHIDEFINYSELTALNFDERVSEIKSEGIDLVIHVFPNKEFAKVCKKAGIKYRLGTTNRIYHWTTCNKLPRISRKSSTLHEAQLNLLLLKDIVDNYLFSTESIASFYGFTQIPKANDHVKSFLKEGKKNIVLHPRSLGSAREWGLKNYRELIEYLHDTGEYNIIVTGTQDEADSMQQELLTPCAHMITDTTGKLTLQELIALIGSSLGLIAASTGPLHIASACGVNALGLFIMTRPMHPGRWRPLGNKADFMVYDEADESLDSILKIEPKKVFHRMIEWT
jgi:heptosyltransferase-3